MGGFTKLEVYTQERRNTLSSGNAGKRLNMITTSGQKITIQVPAKSPKITLNDGYQMPAFGLGTGEAESVKTGKATQIVCDAIDAGYRHFDCAWSSMNEDEIGAGIKAKIDQGAVQRKDLYISSKLWNTFHRRDLVKVGLQQSLDRLGVEYLDLFLIHFPTAFQGSGSPTERYPMDKNENIAFADVDICDTWNAMELLVHKGLVKSIGVSNFNHQQIERILETCTIPPAVVQVEVHPYFSNTKLVEFCQAKNIQVTANTPLTYCQTVRACEPNLCHDPVLVQISKTYGKSVCQVLLRWVLQRHIAIVPESLSRKTVIENFDIFDFHLSEADMSSIRALNRNQRLNNFLAEVGNHREYPFKANF